MRKTLLTLLLSAAAFAGGCQSHNDIDNPVTELPSRSFRAQWTRNLDMRGALPRDMYIVGDDLFIYSSTNLLFRMNKNTGDVIFVSNAADPRARVAAPLVVNDNIVIPADTKLEIIDSRGFQDREIDLQYPMRSGVAGDDKGVYVGIAAADGSGRIVCIDLDKQYSPIRWQIRTGAEVISTPAIFKNTIYTGSADGKVYAVDPDRTPAWPTDKSVFQTGGAIHGNVVADASGVYIPSADSKLYCVGTDDARIKWQYFAGNPLFDTPIITATSVYQFVRGKGLAALDKNEGDFNRKPRWINSDAVALLAEDEKLAFLRSKDDTVLAVDKRSGELRFTSQRDDLEAFAVNTRDGTVYAATRRGKVFAARAVTKPGAVGELVFAEPSDQHTAVAAAE